MATCRHATLAPLIKESDSCSPRHLSIPRTQPCLQQPYWPQYVPGQAIRSGQPSRLLFAAVQRRQPLHPGASAHALPTRATHIQRRVPCRSGPAERQAALALQEVGVGGPTAPLSSPAGVREQEGCVRPCACCGSPRLLGPVHSKSAGAAVGLMVVPHRPVCCCCLLPRCLPGSMMGGTASAGCTQGSSWIAAALPVSRRSGARLSAHLTKHASAAADDSRLTQCVQTHAPKLQPLLQRPGHAACVDPWLELSSLLACRLVVHGAQRIPAPLQLYTLTAHRQAGHAWRAAQPPRIRPPHPARP